MRSSINYEDLGAGKLTQRAGYDIISNKGSEILAEANPPRPRNSGNALRELQNERAAKESPWN